MKALIINEAIIRKFEKIPKWFKEFPNVHRVDLLTNEELREKGIITVDVDMPVIDPETQVLINERYDKDLSKVIFDIIDIPQPSITELAGQKSQEFDNAKDGIIFEMMLAILPKIIRLLKKDLPVELQGLFDALDAEKIRVRNVIREFVDANDYEGLRKFRVIQEDVEYFKGEIKKFKE